MLGAFKTDLVDPAKAEDLIKKLKGIGAAAAVIIAGVSYWLVFVCLCVRTDTMLSRLVVLGNILAFRRLLREAIRTVSEERVPHLFNAVSDAYNQYPCNTYGAAEFRCVA